MREFPKSEVRENKPKLNMKRNFRENKTEVEKIEGSTGENVAKRKHWDRNVLEDVQPTKKYLASESESGGRPDWKQLKQERKSLKRKRKLKESKPGVYELSQEAKQIWECLRPETCPANKKAELSKKLYVMLAPHLQQVVYSHDMVRVLECLVAVGGPAIRESIFNALKADLLLMMKSTYSNFLVVKFLKYGNKSQREEIMKSFEGHVVGLVKHKIAASVVECAYNEFANATQRFKIIKEFFGPEFRIFTDTDCSNLKAVLDKYPAKRQGIMNNLRETLLKLMEKELWSLTMLHTMLHEFLVNCDPQTRVDLIPLVIRGVCDILHTRDGSRVAMISVWYGTAKDRKQIVKLIKPHVEKVCLEEHGHMVLLALLDCVDDTALLSKAIIQEIMKNMELFIGHQHGRKVLHYILTPRATQHFHPDILSILKEGDGKSKKDAKLRQEEILAAAHKDFIAEIATHAQAWSENNGSCMVMSSALQIGTENKEPAFKAIAKLATGTETQGYIEKPGAFKIMKDLLNSKEQEFTSVLIQHLDSDVLKQWISCNRGCLLLATILKNEQLGPNILELLKPLTKKIKAKDSPGAKILLPLLTK